MLLCLALSLEEALHCGNEIHREIFVKNVEKSKTFIHGCLYTPTDSIGGLHIFVYQSHGCIARLPTSNLFALMMCTIQNGAIYVKQIVEL